MNDLTKVEVVEDRQFLFWIEKVTQFEPNDQECEIYKAVFDINVLLLLLLIPYFGSLD